MTEPIAPQDTAPAPGNPAPDRRDPRSPAARQGAGDLSTVGTGSMVAIGCVLGLLLLMLAGVAFLILVRVL